MDFCFVLAIFLVFLIAVPRDLVGETAGVVAGVLFGVGGTLFGVAGGSEVA